MKKYFIFLSLIAGIMLLFACNKDNNNGPQAQSGEMYMTKRITVRDDGPSDTMLISYDDQHRIIEVGGGISSTVYTYNSDGKLSRSASVFFSIDFRYENGMAVYAIYSYNPDWEPSDTVFMEYNSDGLISRRTSNSEILTYTYNSDKRMEMMVKSYRDEYHLGMADTTRLVWDSRGNVVNSTFTEGGYKPYMTYTYDDKPNYNKTLHFPYETEILTDQTGMDYYSANNCTSVKMELYGNSVTTYIDILQYNAMGYPTFINVDTDHIQLFYTQ